jgi:hypothetical protein
MDDEVSRAAMFRGRAQEARTSAKAEMPEDQRQGLLSIADSYDKLAELCELRKD